MLKFSNVPFCYKRHLTSVSFKADTEVTDGQRRISVPYVFKDSDVWSHIPEFVVITGPNGSGKTQLLRYIFKKLLRARNKNYSNDFLYLGASMDLGVSDDADLSSRKSHSFLDKPLLFLKDLFDQYKIKLLAIKKRILNDVLVEEKQILERLYKEYNSLNDSEKKSLHAYKKLSDDVVLNKVKFMETLLKNKKFRNKMINFYSKNFFGGSPQSRLNLICEKFHFKYRFDENSFSLRDEKNEIISLRNEQQSHGEIAIISLIVLFFYVECHSLISDLMPGYYQDLGIILLDESDKHLDQKLCRIFISMINELVANYKCQVIMTTHRMDTITLVPESSVFSLLKVNHVDTHTLVKPVPKPFALFRMSSNLRALIDYHHKVYAESTDDALFYEGVYHTLKDLCDQSREKQFVYGSQANSARMFRIPSKERRLLSDRYQMSFHSVSRKKMFSNKSDGGCVVVINSVERDMTALENLASGRYNSAARNQASLWKKTRTIFSDWRWYQTFGIVDNDYGKDYQLREKPDVQPHIIIMSERHSLENYLFDPIVFCSVLRKDEIERCCRKSNIAFKETDQQLINMLNLFIQTCSSIKDNLENGNFLMLQDHLNIYFEIVFKIMLKYHNKISIDAQRQKSIPIYRQMQAKIDSNDVSTIADYDILFVLSDSETFVVKYPVEFLKIRGHDIGELFWGKSNSEKPTDKVVFAVHENGLKFIPFDLAEIFFNLNHKIRTNARVLLGKKAEQIPSVTSPSFKT